MSIYLDSVQIEYIIENILQKACIIQKKVVPLYSEVMEITKAAQAA